MTQRGDRPQMIRALALFYLGWGVLAFDRLAYPLPDNDWRTTASPSAECHADSICAGCHWRGR